MGWVVLQGGEEIEEEEEERDGNKREVMEIVIDLALRRVEAMVECGEAWTV